MGEIEHGVVGQEQGKEDDRCPKDQGNENADQKLIVFHDPNLG
jgi:hypothetical protein